MTRTFGLSSVFLLSIAIAVVSVRFLFAPLAEVMPHMAHYLPALPLPLYGHLVFGPLALVLMPFQFWTRPARALFWRLPVARPTLRNPF